MKSADKAILTTLSLVEDIFGSSSIRNFAIHLWDGTVYVLTWRNWLHRLEANAEEARSVGGEIFYRIWRLFMAGVVYTFKIDQINAYHMLAVKTDRGESHLPLTRADWYAH